MTRKKKIDSNVRQIIATATHSSFLQCAGTNRFSRICNTKSARNRLNQFNQFACNLYVIFIGSGCRYLHLHCTLHSRGDQMGGCALCVQMHLDALWQVANGLGHNRRPRKLYCAFVAVYSDFFRNFDKICLRRLPLQQHIA